MAPHLIVQAVIIYGVKASLKKDDE